MDIVMKKIGIFFILSKHEKNLRNLWNRTGRVEKDPPDEKQKEVMSQQPSKKKGKKKNESRTG